MSRSTFVRALSTIGAAAALSVGAVMPAAHADFHAYDHVGLDSELTHSAYSDFIDVPDNMLSSAANWTGGRLKGVNTNWWGNNDTFRLNAGQVLYYVGDNVNDTTDFVVSW
ncbi:MULTISPECIES: hypothetical protein [Rothia]|jgi:acyl-coA dehydrogenase|uniref:Acyl-CoA dehydrogenase n=1 Tax=Rothia mucilaginosa TaxID=43675 RepID=A0A930Q017_9MICC|nr:MULTISPECIES: hypothetical protein [Rothia]MBF1673988.1 hypothetical protein [Rothia mucilaginosa]OFQ33966.1 hypothetical protein HMPREF2944_01935 [Rothia sp. HMSC072E10]